MSGGPRLRIAIDFDLVCPWCFIGKRQFDLARERFAAQHPGVVVDSLWRSVQLLPEVPEQGLPFAEFYQRRLGSAEAVLRRRQQIDQAARAIGLELNLSGIERMPNTARAHQLLRRVAALGESTLYEALLDRLFSAYFQRGEDIGDAATLRRLAIESGVTADTLADAILHDALPPAEPAHSGVPFFVFNGRFCLSGAQDSAVLERAMRYAMQAPIVAEEG
jgi:predicted DsbA family dithiol-disulfide isomerase